MKEAMGYRPKAIGYGVGIWSTEHDLPTFSSLSPLAYSPLPIASKNMTPVYLQ